MQQFRWFSLIILALVFVLAGCQGEAITSPSDEVHASIDAPPQGESNPIAIAPVPTSQATPEPNECLTCHSDQQRLIDTVKPEEVVESESSGVG